MASCKMLADGNHLHIILKNIGRQLFICFAGSALEKIQAGRNIYNYLNAS